MSTNLGVSTHHPLPLRFAGCPDGTRIAFMDTGEGSPLVFASNTFGDVHNYRMSWPHVKDITDGLVGLGWRVVRYDVRGMGSSDRSVGDFSLDARVADLVAVVSRLGLTRFPLIGLDHGAATAIAYAARQPERVSDLILLSPWRLGTARHSLPASRLLARTEAPQSSQEWDVLAKVVGALVTDFEDDDVSRRVTEIMRSATSPANYTAYVAAAGAFDLTEAITRIATRTLVIHEPTFPFGSYDLCRDVATRLPNAAFMVIDDRSIAGDQSRRYLTAIDAFLRADAPRPPNEQRLPATSSTLTPRETAVLRLIASGHSNKEIASRLVLSERTVARHVTNLYEKIQARGRADATAYAIRRGLA